MIPALLNQDPPALIYAGPEVLWRPGRRRLIGAASLAVGCVGFGANAFVALTMGGQLYRQWVSHRGMAPRSTEPWLVATGVEAAASMLLAGFLVAAGAIALGNPARGATLHRRYAWVKLPLACVFAGCAAWAVTIYRVSTQPAVIGAAAALALIGSAAYPLFLLRSFPPRRGMG